MLREVKKLLTITLMLISCVSRADEQALKLCDQALSACNLQVLAQKELLSSQEELLVKLVKQRNEAYEEAGSSMSAIPWYMWTIFGLSAGVVLGGTVVFK